MAGTNLSIVTAPGTDAVTLAQAKLQCRVETSETYDDTFLADLIDDAQALVEARADIAIRQTTFDLTLPCFPPGDSPIHIPKPPLISVSSITYTDSGGTGGRTVSGFQTVTGNDSYVVPAAANSWPDSQSNNPNAVVVRFVAGESTVPRLAERAILLLVAHWYKNREDTSEKRLTEIPHAADALIEQLRTGNEFS